MEVRTRVVAPEVLIEEYRQMLQEGAGELPLVISGNSMSPFLIHGRDTVYLSRLTRPPRRGDALLYQRRSGSYVFHRVYQVTEQGLTMVGDAQTFLERGIQPDQIIAVMTAATRKGKTIRPGSFWWVFFEKVWIRMLPLRRPVHGLYTLCCRVFRK